MQDLRDLLTAYADRGDEDAMEELVTRTRPRLLNAVRHLPDAEDALQAAYLALLQARPPGSVAGWLYTTTVRIAYRRKARLRREEEIVMQLGLASAAPRDGDIDAELVRNEVARLPAKYRDPVILHHLNGLATAEVARLLEVEPATARTRLHRGRALLRHRLGPRLAYGVLAVPWLFREAGGVIAGGIVMSRKVGAIVVLVLLLLVGGVWKLSATSDPRSLRPTAAAVGQARAQPVPEPVVEEPQTAPAARAEPKLTGIVVDRSDGPIAGVAVIECEHDQRFFQRMRWLEPQEPARTLTRTDADGRFELKKLQDVKSLIFLKAGYAPAGHDVAPALRVVLGPAQTVVAVVRDRSGRVIPDAAVTASGAGINQRVFTDEEGRVTFDTVPVDERVGVSVNSLGYFGAIPAEVAPEMTFSLKRIGLFIDVVDAETGTPVKEARAVFSRHAEPPRLTLPVNAGALPGSFRERPGQIYTSLFPETKQDGVDVDVHVFALGYRPQAERVSWKRDEEPPRLSVRLERGRGAPSLTGRVTTAARIEIRLRWPGVQLDDRQKHVLVTSIDTDEEGNFGFAGLPAGAYRLVAFAPGYGTVGVDVELPANHVRIELKRAATLDLLARDAGGNLLAHRWFHVETRDRRRWWEVETGADGRVTLDGLTPGDLAVLPLRTQGTTVRESYPGPRVDLVLQPGERRSLPMTVPVPRRITVLVRDDGGNALPGTKVSANAKSGYVVHRGPKYRGETDGVTDESGTVRLDLWPGVYGFGARVGTAHVRDEFTVAADGPDRFELVATLGGAVLKGRVLDSETGQPLAGSQLVAWSRGNRQATGYVDDKGDFVLRGVPQGPGAPGRVPAPGRPHLRGFWDGVARGQDARARYEDRGLPSTGDLRSERADRALLDRRAGLRRQQVPPMGHGAAARAPPRRLDRARQLLHRCARPRRGHRGGRGRDHRSRRRRYRRLRRAETRAGVPQRHRSGADPGIEKRARGCTADAAHR